MNAVPATGGNLVLVIDDNMTNLRLVMPLLNQHDIRTVTALNGQTGLERARLTQPDLILLDIMMPGMDGYEVCRRLKTDPATQDIPVLFLTVLTATGDIVRGFEVGAVDYITKPIQFEELLARVKTHLALRNSQQKLQAEIAQRQAAEEQLRQRNRELLLLNRIGQLFGSSLELDDVLKTVLGEIRYLLGITATSIWFIQANGELACRMADSPGAETIMGWQLAPGEGVVGRVAQQQTPIIIPDVEQADHFRRVGDRRVMPLIRSQLSLPIWLKGEVIAVLSLLDTELNRFSQADITLLEPIVAAAAGAIENARLYSAVRQAQTTLTEEVEARTAELSQANADLQAEIEQRQQQEREKERLFNVVRQQGEQLRELMTWLLESQQDRHRALARTLHDQVMQKLTLLEQNLSLIRDLLPGDDLLAAKIEPVAGYVEVSVQILHQMRGDMTTVKSELEQPIPELQNPLLALSSREKEVLQLLAEGKSAEEIGAMLYLSVNTIYTYRRRIMEKLNVERLADLVKFAMNLGEI